MPSTAILAQGTSFSIAGMPGATLPISAVTRSSAGAVVSCAAPPPVGASVAFVSVANMPEIAGRYGVVQSVVAGASFTVNIDSSAFAGAGGAGTAVAQTWVPVGNVSDYSGFDGTSSEIDTTNLQSVAKEYAPGLEDFGQMTLNVQANGADPGQIALRAAKTSQARTYFLLVTRNGLQRLLFGFVKKFSESGAVDGIVKASVDIRISGRPSFSEVTN